MAVRPARCWRQGRQCPYWGSQACRAKPGQGKLDEHSEGEAPAQGREFPSPTCPVQPQGHSLCGPRQVSPPRPGVA